MAILTITATGAAGYVFDGAGRFRFGPWARIYAIGIGSLGSLVAVVVVADNRVWRLVAAVVIAVLLAVGGGAMSLFAFEGGLPLMSLEGAWFYPLILILFAGAGLAMRSARNRRQR